MIFNEPENPSVEGIFAAEKGLVGFGVRIFATYIPEIAAIGHCAVKG